MIVVKIGVSERQLLLMITQMNTLSEILSEQPTILRFRIENWISMRIRMTLCHI